MFLFRLFTILVGLLVASARGDDPNSKFELKLSLSKSETVQLEPVALTISLKNISTEAQEVYPIFNRHFEYVKIFVTSSSTEKRSG